MIPGQLAAAAIVLVGSLDGYDPHRFSATRPDGHSVTLCGTNALVCHMVGEALRAGRWVPLGEPDMRGAAMRCERAECFPRGHDCIAGYNCR